MKKILVYDDSYLHNKDASFFKIALKSSSNRLADHDVCLEDFIEDNSSLLKLDLLALLQSFSEFNAHKSNLKNFLQISKKINLWDLSLINEKCNFDKSKYFDLVITFLAIQRLLDDLEYDEINIRVKDKKLEKILSVFFNKKKYLYSFNSIFLSFKEITFGVLNLILKTKIFISFGLFNNYIKKTKNNITFFSYLSPKSIDKYKNQYWEGLEDNLKQMNLSTNWIYLWVPNKIIPSPLKLKQFIKSINKANIEDNHISLYNFFSYKAYLKILYLYILSIKKLFHLIRISKNLNKKYPHIWFLFEKDFFSSVIGKEAINTLTNFCLIEETKKVIPEKSTIFFNQENQIWEKSLCTVYMKNANKIGVPHTYISDWDLRFLANAESEIHLLPNYVITNGDDALIKLEKYEAYNNKLIQAEALRYSFLDGKLNSHKKNNMGIESCLVITEYSKDSTKNILNIINNTCPDINREIKFTIKPHPLCIPNINDFNNFDKSKIKIEVESKIIDIVNEYDFVISGNQTSASLECFLLGVPLVIVNDESLINFSPLKNIENINFVSNPKELKEIINNKRIYEKGPLYQNQFFYLNSHKPMWEDLLRKLKNSNF